MGKRRPGRPVTHPPVVCEETGEIFKTYTEAGQAIGRSRVNVMRAATGMQKSSAGYHFKFTDNKEE